jgi:hypothetical protein
MEVAHLAAKAVDHHDRPPGTAIENMEHVRKHADPLAILRHRGLNRARGHPAEQSEAAADRAGGARRLAELSHLNTFCSIDQ